MQHGPQKKSTWTNSNAVVISPSANVGMLLRELMRSYGWRVAESTDNTEKAMNFIHAGEASMIVVDDVVEMPAVSVMRQLISDPQTLLTPTVCFLLDHHKRDLQALIGMGQPAIVPKPLTPAKFIPGFTDLARRWSAEPYSTIRQAVAESRANTLSAAVPLLTKLVGSPQVQSLVTQALALISRQQGQTRAAEKLLLAMLKKYPRDMGVILGLSDLYLNSAMPKLTLRLLTGTRAAFGQSMAMMPDLVQAALMLSRLKDAIDYLNEMYKQDFMTETTLAHLCRLLYSEGREQEAERLLNGRTSLVRKFQDAWNESKLQGLSAAG